MEKRKFNIWILEDDKSCQFVYREILGLSYSLRFFDMLGSFLNEVKSTSNKLPDLLIADIRLPDESFLEFLKSDALSSINNVPLIVVSSVDAFDALETCFSSGAKDYITKPFGKNELLFKINRMLSATQEVLSGVCIDSTTLTVSRNNKSSDALTSKEFQIMTLLHENPVQAKSKTELITGVWGQTSVCPKTLDVHLFHLRKKIASLGVKIDFVPPDSYHLVC